jgi:hypothetical protein
MTVLVRPSLVLPLALTSILALEVAACSGDGDTGSDDPASGGTSSTGGGSALGGAGTTGGDAATGSTPGTGGAGATGATPGTGGTADDFWSGAYDPSGLPNPSDGEHNAGQECLSCHDSLGNRTWSFGGTVYEADGSTPAANVEVGIWDGTTFVAAYSATNGNVWLPVGAGTIDWATAEIRLRSANGEVVMDDVGDGDCNTCHSGDSVLIAP